MLIIWGLSTSVHIGQKAHIRWGSGRWKWIPPPTPSAVMPHYDTHNRPVQTSIKSWLNKETVLADHALCLSNRYLACVLQKSQGPSSSILNFNNCQRGAHRAVVEERKKPPAPGLQKSILELLHTVQYRHANTSMILRAGSLDGVHMGSRLR